MVSHETKRVFGVVSLLFVLVVLAVRILPLPIPNSHVTLPRTPPVINRTPALIFSDNISSLSSPEIFSLSLTKSHTYMWRFDVRGGSISVNLTDPRLGTSYWTLGR